MYGVATYGHRQGAGSFVGRLSSLRSIHYLRFHCILKARYIFGVCVRKINDNTTVHVCIILMLLKRGLFLENIEHDYLTHTYVIYSVVSIIDS